MLRTIAARSSCCRASAATSNEFVRSRISIAGSRANPAACPKRLDARPSIDAFASAALTCESGTTRTSAPGDVAARISRHASANRVSGSSSPLAMIVPFAASISVSMTGAALEVTVFTAVVTVVVGGTSPDVPSADTGVPAWFADVADVAAGVAPFEAVVVAEVVDEDAAGPVAGTIPVAPAAELAVSSPASFMAFATSCTGSVAPASMTRTPRFIGTACNCLSNCSAFSKVVESPATMSVRLTGSGCTSTSTGFAPSTPGFESIPRAARSRRLVAMRSISPFSTRYVRNSACGGSGVRSSVATSSSKLARRSDGASTISELVVASAVTKTSFCFWRCGNGRPRASSGTGGGGYNRSSAAESSDARALLSATTNVSRAGPVPASPARFMSSTSARISSNTAGCAVTTSVFVVASLSIRTGCARRCSGARVS